MNAENEAEIRKDMLDWARYDAHLADLDVEYADRARRRYLLRRSWWLQKLVDTLDQEYREVSEQSCSSQ